MDEGLDLEVLEQPGNPIILSSSTHKSSTVLQGVRISSYLVQNIARKRLLSSSLFPFKNWHSIVITSFFSVTSAAMCIPSPFSPPHTHTHSIHRLCCTWHGRDCTGAHALHHHDTLIVPSLEGRFKIRQPCALCVPGSSAIGGKRVKGEVLMRIAPPFPFSSSNQHSTLRFFKHTGCSLRRKSEVAFGVTINQVLF